MIEGNSWCSALTLSQSRWSCLVCWYRPTHGAALIVGETHSSNEGCNLTQPDGFLHPSNVAGSLLPLTVYYNLPTPPITPPTTVQLPSEVTPTPAEIRLPRALDMQSHWTTIQTRAAIGAICGDPSNIKCSKCGRRFTSHRRLRVHVPQHFTNTFCLCGEYSYTRDYVLKHQRLARCHMGKIFEVDSTSFAEFRDLILPYVKDMHKRDRLLQGFPATRPTSEDEENIHHTRSDPPHTQPLPVVLPNMGTAANLNAFIPPAPPSSEASGPVYRRRRRRSTGSCDPPSVPDTGVAHRLIILEGRLASLSGSLEQCMAEVTRLRHYLGNQESHSQH